MSTPSDSWTDAVLIFSNVELSAEQQRSLSDRVAPDSAYFGDPDELTADDLAAFREAEVAFGSIPPDLLPGAARLRWLQLDSVGCDQYQPLDWVRLSTTLTVTNLRDFFSPAVAETGIAAVLALFRGIDRLIDAQAKEVWRSPNMRTCLRTLRGSQVVIVGYGSIGRAVDERLRPFGCSVIAFGSPRSGAGLVSLDELDQHLPLADVVFLALPATPATAGMFGRERLSLMSPSAIIVNLGRGALIDEDALTSALYDSRLGGAVLDVTQAEPLPSSHKLWTAPRILLTQHTAGGWHAELDAKVDLFLANLELFRRGRALNGIVDWARGY
jgi:glyoxylate/hydroxypyruvate reductase